MIMVRDYEIRLRLRYNSYLEITEGCDDPLKTDRKDAAALWPILKHFAETGRLPEQEQGDDKA